MALLLVAVLALQEGPPPAPPPVVEPAWNDWLHGNLRTLYRNRWTAEASDADLHNSLSLRGGSPDKDLFSFAASGRFQSDLDGDRHVDGFTPFGSLADSYGSATAAHLYTAYVDVTEPLPGWGLRGGRQILDELPEALPIDGGRVTFTESRQLSITLFGGRPVNYFESSASGDATFGGWVEVKPRTRTRFRLEYLHLKDENSFGLFRDDLLGLTAEHGEGPWLFHGRATLLESEGHDILVRASASYPEEGFTLDVRGYYLFEQQQALSFGLDAFAVFLLPVEPYYQLSLSLSKDLSEVFGLDAAVTARQLEDDGDESAHNHEFSRWSFTVRSRKWPAEDLSVSATGDFWQTDADDFWTAGGAVRWDATGKIRAEVGSTYTLYSLDALTGEERERVRSFSLSIRWKVNDDVQATAKFTAEENDIDGFRTLDLGVRYAF